MSFGWINFINAAAVCWLILVNLIAAKKGIVDSFESKSLFIVKENVSQRGA